MLGTENLLEADGFPWFAVRVRSNQEHNVALHLRGRGLEEFTPSYKLESRWSDRIKLIDKPLFPGYVFCRFNPDDRLPVLSAPGVVGLVGVGKVPLPVAADEIGRVRAMVQSGLPVAPWPHLRAGDTVLIEQGPLSGIEGILVRSKGKFRIVVSLNLVQRSISAEIDRRWVRPVPPRRTPVSF